MEIPLYGIPTGNWTTALYSNQTWSAKCWGMEWVNYALPEGLKFALQAWRNVTVKSRCMGDNDSKQKILHDLGFSLVRNLIVQKR